MKFVYLTAQKYPSKKADPFYRKSMAGGFVRALGNDFTFVVRGVAPAELESLNPLSLGAPRSFQTLFYFFRLPFLIRSCGWNTHETVVFSYDPYLLAVAIFWKWALGLKYRVVSDWHQLYEDWRDRYVARGSDLHTTTSRRLKQLLTERHGVPAERIGVAYGGVDPRPFQEAATEPRAELRARLGLPEGFLAAYVGGFTAVGLPKGLDTMLQALTHLPREMSMVFVGGRDGEIEEYRALARSHGVEERCLFIRRQPFLKVVEYERAMDALIIPYPDKPHFREWGFPMKVWEYMAAGRPIIYSNLELIGEVLEGRARSFAPDDAEDLARAIRAVSANREEAEEVAAKNPQDVLAYTWDARARAIIDFIQH